MAVVKLYSKNGHAPLLQPSELEGRTKINSSQQGMSLKIDAMAGDNPDNDALVLEVPVVHNVNVESEAAANVDVSDFIESEFCQITSDAGSIQANRIKTETMTLTTNSGDIICTGHIQGNVKIASASGNIVSEQRFIGPSLDISTDSGDIRVSSSYADQVMMLML